MLADAIAHGKRLLIVGDYDCDGATACAVGVLGLRALGASVDYLVPNRFDFGYGLTPEIVRLAAERRPDILITVDNGIGSVEGVAEANRLGMQVLVTDHHLPGERLPEAACIVNPNQHGCAFPSKHLAGVGVMFYVLLALRAELRRRGAFGGRRASPTSRRCSTWSRWAPSPTWCAWTTTTGCWCSRACSASAPAAPPRHRGAAAGGRARSGARLAPTSSASSSGRA